MESTDNFLASILDVLRFRILQVVTTEQIRSSVEKMFKEVTSPFEGINTEPLLNSFVKQKFDYANYEVRDFGNVLVRKKVKSKIQLCETKEEFIYIPIKMESLQQLLTNVKTAKMVFRVKKEHNEDVFYDIYDGMLYKNDGYFSGKDYILELLIYHDDLGVCNLVGSKAGKHKIDMFYYTLGNIDPKFQSKQCAIRLLAICNTKFVKKYGIDKVLTLAVEDINKLHEGYRTKLLQTKY